MKTFTRKSGHDKNLDKEKSEAAEKRKQEIHNVELKKKQVELELNFEISSIFH